MIHERCKRNSLAKQAFGAIGRRNFNTPGKRASFVCQDSFNILEIPAKLVAILNFGHKKHQNTDDFNERV